MATPMYQDQAAKQRAYRQRRKALHAASTMAGLTPARQPDRAYALQYRQWRITIGQARAMLEATYESLDAWMQDRSEAWQDSDRAANLLADKDRLYELLDSIESLEVLKPAQV